MRTKSDRVVRETSSLWFPVTITVIFLPILTVTLKGQSPLTYLFSFLIGCLPLTVLGLFHPWFNPYVNYWTGRTENSLSPGEISHLKLLKGPDGKKAVLIAMLAVASLLCALYVGTYFVSENLMPYSRNMYQGKVIASFFTFWLTFGYQIFFLSRIIRRREKASE